MSVHIDFMQDRTDRLEEKIELWGNIPFCAICGIRLRNGEQVDGHFPIMSNYNRCEKCKDVPLDDDREFEYLKKR